MTEEKLKEANEVNGLIKDYERALDCFEHIYEEDNQKHVIDLEPRIIIQCNDLDGGTSEHLLPIALNTEMIEILKDHIQRTINTLKHKFHVL